MLILSNNRYLIFVKLLSSRIFRRKYIDYQSVMLAWNFLVKYCDSLNPAEFVSGIRFHSSHTFFQKCYAYIQNSSKDLIFTL